MMISEEKVIKFLNEHVGEETSTWTIAHACIADLGKDADMMEIDYEIRTIARKNGFRLDSSKYRDMEIGFPYVVGFIIKKRKSK